MRRWLVVLVAALVGCDGGTGEPVDETTYAWAPEPEAGVVTTAGTFEAGEGLVARVAPEPQAETEPEPEPVVDDTPEPVVDDTPEPEPKPEPEAAATHPAVYPTDRVQSPITPAVLAHLQAIAALDPTLSDDVFMKVGASGTVSSSFLQCFGGSNVDEGALDDAQVEAWQHFLGGDADGTDPFSRSTLAAKIGMSAVWALTGTPSPYEKELAALNPRWAIVNYGTNDMQLGTTYLSAIWGFADNLTTLVDELAGQGVIPIVTTIPRRLDKPEADLWVSTYNAVIRGLAEARQVPLLDMNLAFSTLTNFGISGDGVHGTVWSGGACVFTDEALLKGYNTRNLITLEALTRQHEVLVGGAGALDEPGPAPVGDGSPEAPIVVDRLPYADMRSTADSPWSNLATYTGCDSDADESGPEVLYRLELEAETRVRALVFDQGSVDIDLHLLDATASEEGCVDRAHGTVEATLPAGVWHFSLDTFVGSGGPHSGEYLFVLLECPEGDPSCG